MPFITEKHNRVNSRFDENSTGWIRINVLHRIAYSFALIALSDVLFGSLWLLLDAAKYLCAQELPNIIWVTGGKHDERIRMCRS